jgi:excinuclease ABC subunit C
VSTRVPWAEVCAPRTYNPRVAAGFEFEHGLRFAPERAPEILRGVPALPGVFALYGAPAREGEPEPQPYLTRTANLHRRMARLLSPADAVDAEGRPLLSKRLNLSARVARIEYTVTGSEFESVLVLYRASAAAFGMEEARRRLRLHTPFFLRFAVENAFPRLYTTNRLTKRGLLHMYGPFASRAAADRYCDAVLDLFLLRRCHEELKPAPDHPGCIYGEMGKCLAPCNRAQIAANAEAYAMEAAAVEAFLNTRGESLLAKLTVEREQASADLDFERAAELHAQVQKVKAAIALADELVQPVPRLRALVVQKAARAVSVADEGEAGSSAFDPAGRDRMLRNDKTDSEILDSRSARSRMTESLALDSDEPMAALFLLEGGCLFGPARLATLGVPVRAQTAVGSSLFAQPLMMEAVPLDAGRTVRESEAMPASAGSFDSGAKAPPLRMTAPEGDATVNPEARAEAVITRLETQAAESQNKRAADLGTLSDHLSLLRRWYYRPEKQRAGEVFFPREDGSWPVRRILRAAARAALGEPVLLPEVRRNLAQKNSADTLPTDSASQ